MFLPDSTVQGSFREGSIQESVSFYLFIFVYEFLCSMITKCQYVLNGGNLCISDIDSFGMKLFPSGIVCLFVLNCDMEM